MESPRWPTTRGASFGGECGIFGKQWRDGEMSAKEIGAGAAAEGEIEELVEDLEQVR